MPILGGGASTRAGTVQAWPSNTIPSGWLKCNGAAVSRTLYAALFNEIGTTYGAGDGSTTFNVPDLRGEFVRGLDDGRGVDASRAIGTGQTDQMQRITGTLSFVTNAGAGVGVGGVSGSMTSGGITTNNLPGHVAGGAKTNAVNFDSGSSPNARTSADTTGETRPRNVAMHFIIKF